MKKYLFIAAICCFVSASAQFKVLSNGRSHFPDGLVLTPLSKVTVEAKNQRGMYVFQKNTSQADGYAFLSRVYNYGTTTNAKCTGIYGHAKNMVNSTPPDRPFLFGVKGLAEDYGYDMLVVDFCSVGLEEAKRRNKLRQGTIRNVPEYVLDDMWQEGTKMDLSDINLVDYTEVEIINFT